jgi:hypothetical protein
VSTRVRNSVRTTRLSNRCTLSLIGCSSLALAMPMSADAEGFLDDSKASLNLRNAYFNRNFTNPAYPQNYAEEWTQSFILDVKSGFTQGTVGFGIDVLGLYSQKLDGGKGTGGTQLYCRSTMTVVLQTISAAWV